MGLIKTYPTEGQGLVGKAGKVGKGGSLGGGKGGKGGNGGGQGGGASAGSTWDPAFKDSDIALSGGNLIATASALNPSGSVGNITPRDASQNRYAEITFEEPPADYNARLGVAAASMSVTTAMPASTPDACYIARDNDVYNNGSGVAPSNSNYFNSTTVGVVYNASTGEVRFLVAGEFLGVAYSFAPGTALFPMAGSGTAGAGTRTATLNTGGSAFQFTLPPGAVAWGGTWNPADKNAAVTLSGSDLVASVTASLGAVRGTVSHNSGIRYFEITWTDSGSGGNTVFGVGTSSATLATWPGNDANAVGWLGSTPTSRYVSATPATIPKLASYTIGIWLNAGAVRFGWEGFYGPNAVTGLSGDKLLYWGVSYTGTQTFSGTLNTGGSAFVNSLPSGASVWG